MSAIPCTVAADTRRYLDWEERADRRAERIEQAEAAFRAELLDSLATAPERIVSTPAFRAERPDGLIYEERVSAADVLFDALGGVGDEPKTHAVCRALSRAAAAGDTDAQMVLEVIATEHAKRHAKAFGAQIDVDAVDDTED
ncbi:MAG: hypothetical protein KIH64_015010 [Mycobacterium sp.]|nr:hypothetical protein [Mycobacterium sp.]